MPRFLDSPKVVTGILSPNKNHPQTPFGQDSEEHESLIRETVSSESTWPDKRRRIAYANLVAIALFFFTIIGGSLTWLGIASQQAERTQKLSELYTNCGSNYSTAIAAGCVYDILAPQWTPPECYNAALSKEHASKIPKPMFFRWSNLTEPVPEDPMEISQYERVWTFDEYHTRHCVYVLELAALAATMAFSGQQDVHLNHMAANARHTKHCTDLLSSNITSPDPTEIRHPGAALRCKTLAPQ